MTQKTTWLALLSWLVVMSSASITVAEPRDDFAAWLKAAESKDLDTRLKMIARIAEAERKPQAAVVKLIEWSQDPESRVRSASVLGLGQTGWLSEDADLALMKALSDKDKAVRLAALDAIKGMGLKCPRVLRQVIKVFDNFDEDRDVMDKAGALLSWFGEHGQAEQQSLLVLLKEAEHPRLEWVMRAFLTMGPGPAPQVLPIARGLLEDTRRAGLLERGALAYFSKFAPANDDNMRFLLSLREDTQGFVYIRNTLIRFAARLSKQSPCLKRLAESENEDDQLLLISMATEMGPKGAFVLPLLKRHLAKHRYVVLAAVTAIGPGVKELLPGLRALMKTQDGGLLRSVMWAIQSLGAAAKVCEPELRAALKHKDSYTRRAAFSTLVSLGVTPRLTILDILLSDHDQHFKRKLLRGLGHSHAGGTQEMLALQPILNAHNQSLFFSVYADSPYHKEQCQQRIVTALKDPALKGAAHDVLGRMGTDARAAIEYLKSLTSNGKRSNQKREALTLLSALAEARDAAELKEIAVRGCCDKDPWVRAAGFQLIGRLQLKDRETIDLLFRGLVDKSFEPSLNAALAMIAVGKPLHGLDTLREAYQQREAAIYRQIVLERCVPLAPQTSFLEPLFVDALSDTQRVRAPAWRNLEALGVANQEPLDIFERALTAKRNSTRRIALLALMKRHARGPRSQALCEAVLTGEDSKLQYDFAQSIRLLGPRTKYFLPKLIPLLQSQDKHLRVRVILTLAQWPKQQGLVEQQLEKALEPSAEELLKALILAVSQEQGLPDYFQPFLIRALKIKHGSSQSTLLRWFKKRGLKALPALEAITALLRTAEDYVICSAIEAIVGLGVKAKASIPVICEVLGHPESYVRFAAIDGLEKWHVDGKQKPEAGVLKALKAVTKDRDESVRQRAEQCLKALSAIK